MASRPSFLRRLWSRIPASAYVRQHWQLMLFAVVMMTAFNFFSHGTQDIYPTFLQKQRGFDHATVSTIAVLYNIAAILGGVTFGTLSQRLGRRRASIAAALVAVPVAFLWAFSATAVLLALGAVLMQFLVQGAWGVVPAHLNELSPPDARGHFSRHRLSAGQSDRLGECDFADGRRRAHRRQLRHRLGGGGDLFGAGHCALHGFGPEAQNVEMA